MEGDLVKARERTLTVDGLGKVVIACDRQGTLVTLEEPL